MFTLQGSFALCLFVSLPPLLSLSLMVNKTASLRMYADAAGPTAPNNIEAQFHSTNSTQPQFLLYAGLLSYTASNHTSFQPS